MYCIYDQFLEVTKIDSSKIALRDTDKEYSYQYLLEKIDAWASLLLISTRERPRVAVLSDSILDSVIISIAVAKINAVCVPTNPQMTSEQLTAGWLATDVNIVVYQSKYANKIAVVNISPFIAIESTDKKVSNKTESLDCERVQSWCSESDFLITLSSGSTGDPKPIVITQEMKALRAQQTSSLYQLNAQDVVLCVSPFFHSLGQRLVFVPLLLGASLVYLEKFSPKKWLEQVQRCQVSFVISVASHLYALKSSLLGEADQLKSLKTIVSSSAPIDAQFKEKIFAAIGCDFHEIYGATEVAIATNLSPQHAATKFTTVGLACEQVEIKILNDASNVVETGTVGQIAVHSPLVFSNYYKRSDLTKAAFNGEYFLTGDLGFIDTEGFLTYVGRQKDIIISGGINIYPKDVEKIISQHSEIEQVAVIGVCDDLLGEVIVAVCVAKFDSEIESDLHRMCRKGLASYQRPLKYFFVEALPLTATGKVSKKALRAEYGDKNDDWTAVLKMMLY